MPRTMPQNDDLPQVSRESFMESLEQIAGRKLTAEEVERADMLSGHYRWLLRNVADDLFGEEHVNKFFAQKLLDELGA